MRCNFVEKFDMQLVQIFTEHNLFADTTMSPPPATKHRTRTSCTRSLSIPLLQAALICSCILPLLLHPTNCYVLRVVGYQNKSHIQVLGGHGIPSESRSDPRLPGARAQIIDVPEYTYPLTMECPSGQKPDGTGRCRAVWP